MPKKSKNKDESSTLLLLGRKIKQSRLKKGMTQEKLSEEILLHSTYIGQIERGEKIPSIESLLDISKALGVSIAYLLDSPEYTMPKELVDLYLAASELGKEDIKMLTEIAKVYAKKSIN